MQLKVKNNLCTMYKKYTYMYIVHIYFFTNSTNLLKYIHKIIAL